MELVTPNRLSHVSLTAIALLGLSIAGVGTVEAAAIAYELGFIDTTTTTVISLGASGLGTLTSGLLSAGVVSSTAAGIGMVGVGAIGL